MGYQASEKRYDKMNYRRCGQSGLKLPELSLGLWHNFGGVDIYENGLEMVKYAFDHGITHFDLANNYGPPPGSAEENFGKMMSKELKPYRDEMIISSKAGYHMWDGPYGDWGSKKYLMSSLDQSLMRMGLEYVDIFYSHRPDPETPIEETVLALDQAVKLGKALYVGISNYKTEDMLPAIKLFKELKTPFVIHQPKYSMFERWVEDSLLSELKSNGIGCIPFSPLAQGLLTEKYLKGIPENSRAAKSTGFLQSDQVTEERILKVKSLKELSDQRGQSISQMAIAWLLRHEVVTSVLVGSSSIKQLEQNLASLDNKSFTEEELKRIEEILG